MGYTFGEKLMIKREILHYSVEQMADTLGVTRQTIWNWENGKSKCPVREEIIMNYLDNIIRSKPEIMEELKWKLNNINEILRLINEAQQ